METDMVVLRKLIEMGGSAMLSELQDALRAEPHELWNTTVNKSLCALEAQSLIVEQYGDEPGRPKSSVCYLMLTPKGREVAA